MTPALGLRTCLALCLAVALAAPGLAQTPREERILFPAGQSSTRLEGRIAGDESVAYTIGAEAGQEMTVTLTGPNLSAYFNVYAPGSGPGDEALANAGFHGPMVPAINRFRTTLATSGEYTIFVYMMRAAARRGASADYVLDVALTGETAPRVEADFADGLQGGPDFWRVIAEGRLNLRAEPSTGAIIVTTLSSGESLRNLGCRMAEGRRWCNVATPDDSATGWVAGDYLAEGR